MIKEIIFHNFRNLSSTYKFDDKLSVIVGKNNTGKTNLLDGIRLAYSAITNDYFKIIKSDFFNSDDSKNIKIEVRLDPNDIPSLNYLNGEILECGFCVEVIKTQSGRYVKKISLLNGADVDYDILREDKFIPNVYLIPLLRVDDIYTDWLSTGISKFIDSDEKYKDLKNESKEQIKKSMESKIKEFKCFCNKFDENLDVELTEPKISDEKVFIVNGDKEHNFKIGSGYKSIANIILNTMDDNYNIILIDEIENHLHPSLIRTLLREIKQLNKNVQIIATSHSSIVVNELLGNELIDISGEKILDLSKENKIKIERFMHSGRSEIIFSDNIIFVEGVTEELLFKYYLKNHNYNWTVINVAGIMFEPYIELAKNLNKRIIVISDNDIVLSENKDKPSDRFNLLKEYCEKKGVTLLNTYNTLESDLYKNGIIKNENLLCKVELTDIYIAKNGKKTLIAKELIDNNVDLSNWHIIKDIINEFGSN